MSSAASRPSPSNPSAPSARAASAATPLVQFRGVQKTYDGRVLVVQSLDLDVERGEFLSLLGPSGSGKTTCLMMLAGFESPTAGEIFLDGHPITRTPPHRRDFGMVFQNYALFPHLTIAQNVAYPLTVRKRPASEVAEKVRKALDMVQLRGRDHAYPTQLSGGQQQRVALARALVFDPKLVLMDEPLGALDKQLREHMQLELKDIHRRLGLTFVYVTHDQDEALTMSDRVAVFNDGRIQQLDAVERLYETPANRFVAGFVGDSTILEGRIAERYGEGAARFEGPGLPALAGTDVNDAAPGTAVVASVRPERIHAQAPGSAAPGGHGNDPIAARVLDVVYFGDHLRLRCEIPGQPQVATVKLPLSQAHAVPTTPGAAVELAVEPRHLRLYA